MFVHGAWMRTIWDTDGGVCVIDQRMLPHRIEIIELHTVAETAHAIGEMVVRGAGLIGAAAGWGMALAAREGAGATSEVFNEQIRRSAAMLIAARPTASNLAHAVQRVLAATDAAETVPSKIIAASLAAKGIADEDAAYCRRIGIHALSLIRALHEAKKSQGKDGTVHILTHCNAGWLAFTDFGSALSPIYTAARAGIPVHVWVDETRPRGQGASLTAFELDSAGISHDIIADNTGGHLMQHGMVDMVIVGADRVTRRGDAANKIGTYLKALAAADNNIPFYVAFPSSTFDFSMHDGVAEIPVEERSPDEVRYVSGLGDNGKIGRVLICPQTSTARNFGFDVTPARLITGLITERGVIDASEPAICALYPEKNEIHAVLSEVRPAADEGVVKFSPDHFTVKLDDTLEDTALSLDAARYPLHQAGLVNERSGIGFGNVSVRIAPEHGSFMITGTATGRLEHIGLYDCAVVEASKHWENAVISRGQVKPSSESMTHAAIYNARPDVQSVIHIHCFELFDALMNTDCPYIPSAVAYGTPDMALSVAELVQKMPSDGIFITLGHRDGIFAFGRNVSEIASNLLALYKKKQRFS